MNMSPEEELKSPPYPTLDSTGWVTKPEVKADAVLLYRLLFVVGLVKRLAGAFLAALAWAKLNLKRLNLNYPKNFIHPHSAIGCALNGVHIFS